MDIYIFNYLNGFAGQNFYLDKIIIFCADYLGGVLLIGLVLLILTGWDKKKEIKMFLTAVFSVIFSRLIFTEIIRFIYARPRPFITLHANNLLEHRASASFPSGHAAFYFAIAAAVSYYHKKAGFLFVLGAITIGVSRVIAGVHYPSDILAGAILGYFSVYIIDSFLMTDSFLEKLYKNFYRTKNLQQ